MKLSVSAFRAQASAQRKILSSYQNQLNYGTCTSLPAVGRHGSDGKLQMMVDNTGVGPTTAAKSNEGARYAECRLAAQEAPKAENVENEVAGPLPIPIGRQEGTSVLEKSPGRTRSRSNQRWMKLRTTVQLSGAISGTSQKSKPPLKREDSFLKRFSTRQIPETQETVDTGDETETLNGSQTQNEVNRRRRKRRKEMSKTVVNPDENFYFYWLMTVTVCVLYNLWTLIVRQSFPELQKVASAFWYSGDGFADIVFACDIVVQFRTGYLEQGLMVYDSKKLATHYLKSRAFALDVLSLLPLDFLQMKVGINPMLRFPRFFKIYRVYTYYYMVESRTVYPNLWRVVNLIHILLILAHWFGCFYYLLSEAEGFQGDWVYPHRSEDYATLTRKYLGSLYWSTLTLTTIGDLPTPETNAESRSRSKAMTASGQSEGIPRRGHKSRLLQFNSNYGYLFTIISYLIGVFIFATIVGQVGNVITNRNANRLEFERLLDGAKTYMRHHKVPGGMKRRVLRWYDYSWSRGRIQGGGDINTALGLLPDKLKTELALHVNLSVLKKVTIFQECQPEFLHDLVLKMKAYIFTPGDLICRKGEVAREMFIIADGILDVISETGRVLTTMKAGDFFGEIGILNLDGLNKRTADVRSVGYSELFSLSREDVLTAMKDYPEAQEILQSLGRKRLMEAKNASKVYKIQAKQSKDHDSSGESDTAGKRIVEKLRSDVKGLKNALRRSRRGTRTKDTLEAAEEGSGGKTRTKKHSILRRMSHVQSSDEYEANNDEHSPIGVGLPLLQRLKLLKEKQEREREEKESNKFNIPGGSRTTTDEGFPAETGGISLPFTHKLKLLKQKDLKDSAAHGATTVRTQATGVRFDKSIHEAKNIGLPGESEKTPVGKTNNDPSYKKKVFAEHGRTSPEERTSASRESQIKEKSPPLVAFQEAETVENSSHSSKTQLTQTSTNGLRAKETIKAVPISTGNKSELPKSKDAWTLLKKSSISPSKACGKSEIRDNKPIEEVFKREAYLSKSDTILERQKTVERQGKKRSETPSPPDGSNLEKTTPESRPWTPEHQAEAKTELAVFGGSATATPTTAGSDRKKFVEIKKEMKKYNSISDLSPEYSGLPFVKKLKILNERQKLEELEKELFVRSVSLDVPHEPAPERSSVLVRSQSEATTIDRNLLEAPNFRSETEARRQREAHDESFGSTSESHPEFRDVTREVKKQEIHSECFIASPESNETLERRNLKSILKKLSAEDGAGNEYRTPMNVGEGSTSRRSDNSELKKLMRAPTVEGYAARHKKLTKSVTFDGDTPPGPADDFTERPPDEGKGKGFTSTKPTAIFTLQLSSFGRTSTSGLEKAGRRQENIKLGGEKNGYGERSVEEIPSTTPQADHESLEGKIGTSPRGEMSDEEFFSDLKGGFLFVLQRFLEEVESNFQSRFDSLRNEVRKRDEIITELQSKICTLEVKRLEETQSDAGRESLQRAENVGEMDQDPPRNLRQVGSSFPGVADVRSFTVELLDESALGEISLPSVENSFPLCGNEDHFVEGKDEFRLSQTRWNVAQSPSPERDMDEELELAELSRLPRSIDFARKGLGTGFRSRRNFVLEETQLQATSKSEKAKDGKKEPKRSFINRVTSFQRTFSCSQDKSADFITLDIDDGSNSSDVENNDWEVQMLVEELSKKDPDWKAEDEEEEMGEWKSNAIDDHLAGVRQLQQEVNALKHVVCESDLKRLTTSELDVLETIIEAKDRKISQITKSSSLNDEEESAESGRQLRICAAVSDNGINERSKRTWLRQKLGRALSFDFPEVERRKPTSSFATIREAFLGKQNAFSRSPRQRQKGTDSWYSSVRRRNESLECSGRTKEKGTVKTSASSLPVLAPSFLFQEETRDPRTSLLTFSSRKFPPHSAELVPALLGSPEEKQEEGGGERGRDRAFEKPETPSDDRREETGNFGSPAAGGSARPRECLPGSTLNNFIKSVGQKVKQAVIGDANPVRNQVPTISKLCDDQSTLKDSEAPAPEEPRQPSPEVDVESAGAEPSEILNFIDRDQKIEAPDS